MRSCHHVLPLLLFLSTLAPATANEIVLSDQAVYQLSLLDTTRSLEAAKAAYRHYRFVEYPRELRQLDSAIKITRKEVGAYKRRVREYGYFGRHQQSNPLFVTLQHAELNLLASELRLKDLQADRRRIHRERSSRIRALEFDIYSARIRLQDLVRSQ